jgi:hypothetical protein
MFKRDWRSLCFHPVEVGIIHLPGQCTENIQQVQGSLDIFLVSPLPLLFPVFLFLFHFYPLLFLIIKLVNNTFSQRWALFSSMMMWPRKCRHLRAVTKCKELVNTGSSRLNDGESGVGGDRLSPKCPFGDMCLFWVTLTGFHTVIKLLELFKERRYLNTWHCSSFGIHVICIELRDSVS